MKNTNNITKKKVTRNNPSKDGANNRRKISPERTFGEYFVRLIYAELDDDLIYDDTYESYANLCQQRRDRVTRLKRRCVVSAHAKLIIMAIVKNAIADVCLAISPDEIAEVTDEILVNIVDSKSSDCYYKFAYSSPKRKCMHAADCDTPDNCQLLISDKVSEVSDIDKSIPIFINDKFRAKFGAGSNYDKLSMIVESVLDKFVKFFAVKLAFVVRHGIRTIKKETMFMLLSVYDLPADAIEQVNEDLPVSKPVVRKPKVSAIPADSVAAKIVVDDDKSDEAGSNTDEVTSSQT